MIKEINQIIEFSEKNKSQFLQNEDGTDIDSEVEQRSISENDLCPICQEEFLIKKLPITYCRYVKKGKSSVS